VALSKRYALAVGALSAPIHAGNAVLSSDRVKTFEFLILGPVEARADGDPLPLGGPRQRGLVAYLLVHANHVVPAATLIEELWSAPPGDAAAALQNQISRLRKALGDRLVTKAPGYLLRIEPGELDLDRFRAFVAEAGGATDAAERSRLLRAADSLFRGTPFAEVDAPFAAGEAAALEELRLAAVEARIDADLSRARHAELVPELSSLIAHHPLRERLRRQLILALYRCDRQADALEAYRETRRILDQELGLEPSEGLRELERAILRHDPELDLSARKPEDERPTAAPRWRRTRALAVVGAVVAVGAAGAGAAVVFTRTSGEPSAPQAAAAAPAAPRSHRATPAPTKKDAKPKRSRPHATKIRTVTEAVAPAPAPTVVTTAPAAPTHAKPRPSVTTTSAVPTKTTGPPTAWTTLSDDFSGTTPNVKLWNTWSDGSGASSELVNGRLEFTIPANAQTGGTYNLVGPAWGMQCRFDGDFDARIDYQLLEWPAAVGAHVQLSSWIFPDVNSASGRQTNQYADQYSGNINQHFTLVTTTDTKGTLRLARTNGVQSSYYLSNGKWLRLESAKASGPAQIGIQLFGMANEWTHQEVRVAFDNFSISAPALVCP
jgi:DNA-binding SARP family transcriptional activator